MKFEIWLTQNNQIQFLTILFNTIRCNFLEFNTFLYECQPLHKWLNMIQNALYDFIQYHWTWLIKFYKILYYLKGVDRIEYEFVKLDAIWYDLMGFDTTQ